MIDSIKIKNFETHLNTAIKNLHPGVNVVIGESDEGKSGLIRSIELNAKNTPMGDSYVNDQIDPRKKKNKSKITSVEIDYKNSGTVTRARGIKSGLNTYQINNNTPLRALRTDIPDEVQDITKMKAVNIQGQHPSEQYFLLADKPGQVAKELNKVSGLTIMDKATADINSQVRLCNTKIKLHEKEIDKHQKEIDNTKWVDKAEKFANKLKTFETKIDIKQKEHETLGTKITQYRIVDTVLKNKFVGLDDAIKGAADLVKEAQDIIFTEHEQEILQDLIVSIKFVDKDLKSTTDIEKALTALKELKTLRENINKKQKKRNRTKTILFKLTALEIDIQNADRDCKEWEKEYKIMREEQECPTCGRTGK